LYWPPDHRAIDLAGRLRQAAAGALRAASRGLDRWAHDLTAPPKSAVHDQVLEFHVAPGDNGGTVYVNGRRVGKLPGVMRL
jgi:hypothetical protein